MIGFYKCTFVHCKPTDKMEKDATKTSEACCIQLSKSEWWFQKQNSNGDRASDGDGDGDGNGNDDGDGDGDNKNEDRKQKMEER